MDCERGAGEVAVSEPDQGAVAGGSTSASTPCHCSQRRGSVKNPNVPMAPAAASAPDSGALCTHNTPRNTGVAVATVRISCRKGSDPDRSNSVLPACRQGEAMSTAAHDESPHPVDDLLDGRLAALRPEAERLRATLLRGESPESLGLTEDGLARVLEERGTAQSGRFHFLETPLALDRYKQASTQLLTMLDQVVNPTLVRTRRMSLVCIRSGSAPAGFTFEIESPGGGLALPAVPGDRGTRPRPRPGPRHLPRAVGSGRTARLDHRMAPVRHLRPASFGVETFGCGNKI